MAEQAETQEQPAAQQSEDSFFDPNSVPEDLIPAYKQMQAAFTKKTQEIAEARKSAEQLKADAEAYKQYKQYIPIVEQMLANKPQPTGSPELAMLEQEYRKAGYDDQSIEFMKMGIGFALNHFNNTQQVEKQQAWVSTQIQEAAKVDARLTDQSLTYQTDDGETQTFGEIVEELVAADPNWVKDPVAATRRAVKKVDALIGRAKTDGKAELSNLAKSKAQKFPQTAGSPQSATASTQPKSITEAFKQAQRETGITLKS